MHRTPVPPRRTSEILVALAPALLLVAASTPAEGAVDKANLDCGTCHISSAPFPGAATLAPCPGHPKAARTDAIPGPRGTVLLDSSHTGGGADLFGPVPFNHERHARWANLSGGCGTCHHRSPAGPEQPTCSSCHEATDRHQNMNRPGLKGAYHRQCLGCHREWSHTTRCDTCHLLNPGAGVPASQTATRDDIIGVSHPLIVAPDALVYSSDHPLLGGSDVFFDHRRHVDGYALLCVDCHAGNACSSCHDVESNAVGRHYTLNEVHTPCVDCHDTATGDCDDCHRAMTEGPPEAFTHDGSDVPGARYHRGLACRACHGQPPYRARPTTCTSCHQPFEAPHFDHRRASGLRLSSDHVDLACDDCHSDASYSRRPTCEECHDDFAFPAKSPGRRMP